MSKFPQTMMIDGVERDVLDGWAIVRGAFALGFALGALVACLTLAVVVLR